MPTIIMAMRCNECDTPSTDPDNPEITYAERKKYNSWSGWMCKCGHYNATDK